MKGILTSSKFFYATRRGCCKNFLCHPWRMFDFSNWFQKFTKFKHNICKHPNLSIIDVWKLLLPRNTDYLSHSFYFYVVFSNLCTIYMVINDRIFFLFFNLKIVVILVIFVQKTVKLLW